MTVTGKRIKQAREHIGVSQTQFGELAGLNKRDANIKMNQYEVGGTVPKYNFVLKLSAASGLPEYFFYINDDVIANSLIEAVNAKTTWVVDLAL